MNDITSPTQSAFVGGRNILDSPLMLNEIVAWAKKSKKKLLIFKVDFQKAYDSINWKFLFRMMNKMGFPSLWVSWIKGCLVSAWGSILVNGSPTKQFKFKRGLRQGDPLSPFLFVIAMEIISLLMNRACQTGLFKGCNLPNNGPIISHLCYADDVIFIGEWSNQNILAINRLLRWLYLVSGLKVNRQKSKLFGIGASEAEVVELASLARCDIGSLPFSYLGIPVGVNMKKACHWSPVIEKFFRVLSKWKARHLSFAGRMTLAKSVLGSLPSYFLSLFAAPKCVLNKLEKIRRNFIWGKSGSGIKMRWLRWNFLTKSKKAGGMGLGDIHSFNKAMLSKWWWRFKENPDQLWAEVIRSIHSVSNGSVSNVFIPIKKSIPGAWKDIISVEKVFAEVGINLKDRIVQIGEKWIWLNDPNASFSVKKVRSDLEEAANLGAIEPVAFRWNPWVPPKVNVLAWRAILGKIASKMGLHDRGIPISDTLCPRCGMYVEDPAHIFVKCLWAKSIWWSICTWMRVSFPADIDSLADLVAFFLSQPGDSKWKKTVYSIALVTVWRIWIARNSKAFEDIFIPVSKSVELIKEEAFIWIFNRSKLKALTWGKWLDFDLAELM
ncbi:putative RNA-directed DNA polymerase [Helianthus annuus]|nr:putative RNA-directed DNA polymerase [Helianthus annuus]